MRKTDENEYRKHAENRENKRKNAENHRRTEVRT